MLSNQALSDSHDYPQPAGKNPDQEQKLLKLMLKVKAEYQSDIDREKKQIKHLLSLINSDKSELGQPNEARETLASLLQEFDDLTIQYYNMLQDYQEHE